MLAYLLAIVIAMGSVSFYLAAFFVPEIHRRQDFLWSGLGLFYALVLWYCAGRITGAVLLGQLASGVLLGGLAWHTLTLRRALTPASVRTPVTWAAMQRWVSLARQQVRQTLQGKSLLAGILAIAAAIARGVRQLQQQTAGPRGQSPSAPEVPPLRRSPAYEFEIEAGRSESVPSEFATVPARQQRTREQPPQRHSPPADSVSPAPATAPNPVAGVTTWMGEVIARLRRPQPSRPVIEIPPRPPSIPRSPAVEEPTAAPADSSAQPPAAQSAPAADPDDESLEAAVEPSTDGAPAQKWPEAASADGFPHLDKNGDLPAASKETPREADAEESNWPD